MVVGEMSSFSLSPAFHIGRGSSSSDAKRSARSAGGGMKSFMSGVMGPLTACWAPDASACVPGCAPDYHSRGYDARRGPSQSPAVVSPLLDRVKPPQYDIPVSPVQRRYEPVPPTSGAPRSTPAKEEAPPAMDIDKPHSHDVLCGRGGSSNRHLGNMNFRELVAANKKMYVGLTKKQKMLVARKIVDLVHNTEPPGRFLSKDLDTGRWYDIGLPRSLEKTSQALREKNSNESPLDQGTDVSDVLSDASVPASTVTLSDAGVSSPASGDVDKQSTKISSRSGKQVEAPPLTIPPHLVEVYHPKKSQDSDQAWPDYSPSASRSRPPEQPYLGAYPPTPASPRDEHYAMMPRQLHYDMSPASPQSYHASPHPYSHPPDRRYPHTESPPPQDYREYYDYYQRGPDPRDHYGQPSPHRAPPPAHYRAYPPPPPPPGQPPRPHRLPHHLPPRRPPSMHPATPPYEPHHGYHPYPPPHPHHRYPEGESPSGPPRMPPASPVSTSSKALRSPGKKQGETGKPVLGSPNGYIRGKSEVSPERRQEWKRQRNEQGAPRRLSSDCSLSRAVENSLTLEERIVGRERTTSSSAASGRSGNVAVKQNGARELMSPSASLQSRGVPRGSRGAAKSALGSSTLTEKEGDAITALSGLAALSTAAFLKLDETD
eukprot:Nitzschia sp. Nitz4//scaffold234_size30613//14124//16094//NITZ4_007963-RA/size30613-processed-gene-0.21-mRNA-1//-1//CDS//3329543416//3795//frame0